MSVARLPSLRRLSPTAKTLVALGVYGVWTATTWLLEGRIQTLLRPGATLDRLVYTLVANVLVGTVIALVVVGAFVTGGVDARARLGFRSPRRTLVAVGAAGVVGSATYLGQNPPTTDPVVVANAFAQVLPVSVAELLVCWVLVGGSVAALLSARGAPRAVADGVALLAASVLFGAYHVAHSPPFDEPRTIALLAVVSLATGLWYFAGRSFYGALVLHASLALVGVTAALAAAGRLGAYRAPSLPLFATALVSAAVLVAAERTLVGRADEG